MNLLIALVNPILYYRIMYASLPINYECRRNLQFCNFFFFNLRYIAQYVYSVCIGPDAEFQERGVRGPNTVRKFCSHSPKLINHAPNCSNCEDFVFFGVKIKCFISTKL